MRPFRSSMFTRLPTARSEMTHVKKKVLVQANKDLDPESEVWKKVEQILQMFCEYCSKSVLFARHPETKLAFAKNSLRMLSEIAAEVLQFLSRRDLDKACGVNKWLDGMIAQCCDVYPLRPAAMVSLLSKRSYCFDSTVEVSFKEDGNSARDQLFSSMAEAAQFAGTLLHHSYVENVEVRGDILGSMVLLPEHWTALIDAIRIGTVRRLDFNGVDFSALNDVALLAAVGCRGLQSLVIRLSVVPDGLLTDELLRSSAANGLFELWFLGNNSDTPPRFSEDALLDFYFTAGAAPGRQSRSLRLEGRGVTAMFLAKFLERLQSSSVRPSGSMDFEGAPMQRGLAQYDRYLTQGNFLLNGQIAMDPGVTYRFPSVDGDSSSYELTLCEGFAEMHLSFNLESPSAS